MTCNLIELVPLARDAFLSVKESVSLRSTMRSIILKVRVMVVEMVPKVWSDELCCCGEPKQQPHQQPKHHSKPPLYLE